jgi:uncharacterized membrane protein
MIEIIPNWHPIFVHFTVALLSVAVALHLVVRFIRNEKLRSQWEIVAQWNLWLGALITLVTVVMGYVAYNTVAHDTPSHAAMTEHRNWALVTASLFVFLAAWSAIRARAGQGINTVILVGLLAGGGLLMSTAWHGGEAVYRFGLGVMSLPKTDTHEHSAAGHADGGGHDEGGEAGSDGHAHDAGSGHDEAGAGKAMSTDGMDDFEMTEEAGHGRDEKLAHDNSDGHAH